MLHRTSSFTRSVLFLQLVVSLSTSGGVRRFGGPFRSPNRTQSLPIVCKDGWTAAVAENLDGGQSTPICIRVNSQPMTWEQSRDSCRANQAFLLKLDQRVKIGTLTLEQYVQMEQLSTFWTGLHEEDSKLVWDDYRQPLVQAYIGPHAGYGKIKRGWRWNADSFLHVDDSCGVISLNRTHTRRSRSTKDFDDLMQARHNIDLDLPDSAPQGFRAPFLPQNFPPVKPNSGEKIQSELGPPQVQSLGALQTSVTDSSEPPSKETDFLQQFPPLHSANPQTDGSQLHNSGKEESQIVATEAPELFPQVTEISEEEKSKEVNPDEVMMVKRSTLRRTEVTETPQLKSEEDTDSKEVTTASSEAKSVFDQPELQDSLHKPLSSGTVTTSSSTTITTPSVTITAATSDFKTTTSASKTTITTTTTNTSPSGSLTHTPSTTSSSTSSTSASTSTSTTSTSATTSTSTASTSSSTSTTSTSSSTSTTTMTTATSTSTTSSTTTTTMSPTTALRNIHNVKESLEASSVSTPSSLGTSRITAPLTITASAQTPTTPSSTTAAATTTTTKRATKWKMARASAATSTHPPSSKETTAAVDSVLSVPHFESEGLPHAERFTSGLGGLSPSVTPDTNPGNIVQFMNLDSCDSFHPSVCYSEPVQTLQPVSFCGRGWVGHPQVNKCYKVLAFPLAFFRAKSQCVQNGGTLASVDSDYYGNLTAMAYIQFRNINRGANPRVWVDVLDQDKLTLSGGCPALDNTDVIQLNCQVLLFSVCEKAAILTSFADVIPPSLLQQKDILRMISARPQPITCPISTSVPEEQVLWFKDGILIQDSTNVRTFPRFSTAATQQRAKTLYLNMTLLRRLGYKSRGNVVHLSLLQGNYWCEVWRLNPFVKVRSPNVLVIFTDVVTLHGTLQTQGIPVNTSVIFNYMDRAVDVPSVVAHDLAIINNNISRSMRMADPVVKDIASYVDHVDSETGIINFFIQLTLTRNIPERHKDRVVSLYLSSLHSLLSPLSRDIAPHWNLSLPVTQAITLTRTDYCPTAYLEDEKTGYGAQFPQSPIGRQVDSIETCDGVSVGYAYCNGNYETGASWEDWQVDTDCNKPSASELPVTDSDDVLHKLKPNITEPVAVHLPQMPPFDLTPSRALVQLDQIEIEDGNVLDVTDKMAEIIGKSADLTDADIDACAEVMSRIVKITPPANMIGHQLLNTVNRILDADVAAITSAQKKTRAATRIINNLEKFSMKTDIGSSKSIRLVTPNVAMEVWDLDPGMDPVIGLGAKVGGSWTYPLTDTRILTIRDRSDSKLAGFDVAIELPQELVMETMKESDNSTRLSMLIYRKTGLFSPVFNSSIGVVNSAIISATLGGKTITGLQNMVRMAFRPFQDTEYHLKRTRCGFWDFKLNQDMGGWSSEGCHYNGTMYGLDICMCDHLTNFAVLLDFYGHSKPIEPSHELSLSIISLVGLSLSIFGLALTIITFIFFKKLRQGRAQQTLFHMAVALLCSKVVFLVGIKQTNNEYFCLSVAVLLHYFILVSFLWMLIEAILQYMTFVKILGTYVSRYALKTILPAWGVPLIPVICVLSIDYNMYRGREAYCWMGMEAFYYAFALPVGIIVVFNIAMFIIILISLVRRPDGLRSTQSKQRRAKMHLKAAVTIFILLGLTWIFGFLQIEDARIVFQYIFTFLSSLQGFFIFILLVARRKQVREQWLLLCCNRQEGHRAPKQVSPTNSNSTSSNGSGGSLSLHNSSTRTLTSNINRESFDSVYYIPTRRPPPPYKAL